MIMAKKQTAFRLSEYHTGIIDEVQEIYKIYGLKYSKAEVVELALTALIKQPVTMQDDMVNNVYFRGNVPGLIQRKEQSEEE